MDLACPGVEGWAAKAAPPHWELHLRTAREGAGSPHHREMDLAAAPSRSVAQSSDDRTSEHKLCSSSFGGTSHILLGRKGRKIIMQHFYK